MTVGIISIEMGIEIMEEDMAWIVLLYTTVKIRGRELTMPIRVAVALAQNSTIVFLGLQNGETGLLLVPPNTAKTMGIQYPVPEALSVESRRDSIPR
jgi:hypothetical protein